ncbi:MAG TPA: TetR/AcrR family transcriptional regulator [Novosphingobium sp.]
MNEVSEMDRPRAGRPTREQAEARHQELLDRALEHFLDKGFEQATIDAIAADVGMTKRTVYARYADKASLFHAALLRAIERYSVSKEEIFATDVGDIEQTLINIAMLRIDLIASRRGLKLQRVIQTESYRFPGIFEQTYDLGARPTIDFLVSILQRETAKGHLAIAEPQMAANVFMSMAVSAPVRIILSGLPLSKEELDERLRFAVRLFLDGTRPR